ncbi:MAG: HAD family hydrolase [Thermodesulfovibrionales bacterium]
MYRKEPSIPVKRDKSSFRLTRFLGSPRGFLASFLPTFALLVGIVQIAGVPSSTTLLIQLLILSLMIGALVYMIGRNAEIKLENETLLNRIHEDSRSLITPLVWLTSREDLVGFFKSAEEIRIFASGSDTYHTHLRALLAEVHRTKRLSIRVLMRDDGTLSRRQHLERQCQKWLDIKRLYPVVDISVRFYKFTTMFRGMISDRNLMVIGWYERSQGKTYGQECPAFLLSASVDRPLSRELINIMVRTFDNIYDKANERNDGWEQQPGKVVVFDLDGTFYSTKALDQENEEAIVSALSEFLHISQDEAKTKLSSQRTTSSNAMISLLSAAIQLNIPGALIEKYQFEKMQPEKHIYQDSELVNLLKALRNNMKIALLTNTRSAMTERILRQLGFIREDFDVILTGDMLDSPKPSSTDLVRAVKLAGGDLRFSMVVGDRKYVDLLPGHEVGMETYLVASRDDTIEIIRQQIAQCH